MVWGLGKCLKGSPTKAEGKLRGLNVFLTKGPKYLILICCIFWPAVGYCASKRWWKSAFSMKFEPFLSLYPNAGRGFYSLFYTVFLPMKTAISVWLKTKKTYFLFNFVSIFLAFSPFQLLLKKGVFDQHLWCSASTQMLVIIYNTDLIFALLFWVQCK